jgi:hypothetical protein
MPSLQVVVVVVVVVVAAVAVNYKEPVMFSN